MRLKNDDDVVMITTWFDTNSSYSESKADAVDRVISSLLKSCDDFLKDYFRAN